MEIEVGFKTVRGRIVEKAKIYFEQTGEEVSEDFLSLIVDSLFDEYKAARKFPDYFTEGQIEVDTMQYFGKKCGYFALKVIPAIYGKIGAEGLNQLTDNQVSRTWGKENYFADVTPYCEVL